MQRVHRSTATKLRNRLKANNKSGKQALRHMRFAVECRESGALSLGRHALTRIESLRSFAPGLMTSEISALQARTSASAVGEAVFAHSMNF